VGSPNPRVTLDPHLPMCNIFRAKRRAKFLTPKFILGSLLFIDAETCTPDNSPNDILPDR
jgi:hypothetical protein